MLWALYDALERIVILAIADFNIFFHALNYGSEAYFFSTALVSHAFPMKRNWL
jgi:hypothetical protein